MKTVYPDKNNVVIDKNSVERKPCINRESKSLELTIQLYSCHNINMKFLVVVTPPSIYKFDVGDICGSGGFDTGTTHLSSQINCLRLFHRRAKISLNNKDVDVTLGKQNKTLHEEKC